MLYVFLFIFIFLSNFSCTLDDSPPITINNYLTTSDESKELSEYIASLYLCIKNYSNVNESKNYLIFKCIINETKRNEEHLKLLLQAVYSFDLTYELFIIFLQSLNDTKIVKIFEFLREDIKNGSFVIDGIFSLLNHTDSYGKYLLDYVYNILDNLQHKQLGSENILKNISLIFQNFNVYDFYSSLKNQYPKFIINVIELFLEKSKEKAIYDIIRNNSGDLHDEVIFLIMDVAVNFLNETKTIRIVGDFLYNHIEILDLFKKIIMNDGVKNIIRSYFKYQDKIINALLEEILKGGEIRDLIFEVFSHKELIKEGEELIINIYTNGKYIENYLPPYLKKIHKENNTYLSRAVKGFMYIGKNLTGQVDFLNAVIKAGQKSLLEYFKINNLNFDGVSFECKELFNTIFFNKDPTTWKPIFFLYLKKFIFDSPRNKDDFLDFDNCMDIANTSLIIQNNISYQIEPAFIIGILDDPNEKRKLRNSTFYEKYYYISNFCLPYGYKNNNITDPMCKE